LNSAFSEPNSTYSADLGDGATIILPSVSEGALAIDDEEQTESTRTALAVTMPLIVALVIGLLLYKKKRRTMTASEFNEMMASDYVIVGTGDPPGSFHEGLYHYTKDGRRYLSTRCENCLETRRVTFYSDRVLPTILENETFYDDGAKSNSEFIGVISPDSKDLGNRHLGIDVHRCTSSVCPRCNNHGESPSVNFIESRLSMLRNQEFSLTQQEAAAYRSYGSDSSTSSNDAEV
jgi:hypothetical protein